MRVVDIYRYPVKSMQGERLETATLTSAGIPGDRAWALQDRVQGGTTGAKKLPYLMSMWARFSAEPDEETRSPEVRIRDDNGFDVTSARGDADARLSEILGHPVTLWPLQPDGHYFDAFPLLIVTRSSLAALDERAAEAGIDSCFDVRRFRPNVLLDVDDEGFVENAWEGRTLRIGEAEVAVKMACGRCVMTTHGFADLPRDPKVLRALVRHNAGNLGVYASVARGGRVKVGDEAHVL